VELLSGIEQLALVRGLKSSFYTYPLVNALHIASIGMLFAAVWLMDLRILGFFRALPEATLLATLRKVALIAFATAVLTGAALFSVRAMEYAMIPVFWAKMMLVLLAGANLGVFLVLNRRRRIDAEAGFGERLAAGVSAVMWTAALVCGRFIGFA